MQEAHEIATNLEESVRNELGEGIELNSHIEPLRNESVLSSDISKEEMEKVVSVLMEADKEVEEISEIHNILVRKIGDKFFASFHCLAPADLSIELVHDATNKFEYLMKNSMKEIKRVVIHVEPIE
jgi:divalent metal cation (Fe/Co/Zn/Cd) transporter